MASCEVDDSERLLGIAGGDAGDSSTNKMKAKRIWI